MSVCLFVGPWAGGSVGLFVCLLVRFLFSFCILFLHLSFGSSLLSFQLTKPKLRWPEVQKIPKYDTKPLRNQMERCPCQSLCKRLSGGFVSSAAFDEVNTGPK